MKKFYLTFCAAFLLVATISAQNVAKNCVLFELFTGVNCTYCPANANGVAQMLAEELDIAPIAYHTNAFSTAAYYTAETNARTSWYGVTSYPTTKSDGVLTHSGGGTASQNTYNQLLPLYTQRIGIPSPFTINLTFTQLSATQYQANVTVDQVGTCTAGDLRVMIVYTQSNINQNWQGMTKLNCVVRDMMPDHNGTVYNGGTQTVTEVFDIGDRPKEDLHLVAWVQSFSTKEVFQCVRLTMNTPDFDYDLGITEISNASPNNCSGKINPTVTVKNFGGANIESFDIVSKINGTEVNRYHWTGSAFGFTGKVSVNIPEFEFPVSDDEMVLDISVENPNGEDDMLQVNDNMTFNILPAIENDGYLTLNFKTDDHPEETTVRFICMDNDVVLNTITYPAANTTYTNQLYMPWAGCYRLEISDEGGDGITTYFTVKGSDNSTLYNGAAGVNPFRSHVDIEFHSTQTTAILLPPTNVTAEQNGIAVDLAWEMINGGITPESYNIYRNGIYVDNVTTQSFSDEVPMNDTYCYSIKSVANGSESDASQETCLDVVVLFPPVIELTVTAASEIIISWDVPAEGLTPVSYNIYKNGKFLVNTTELSHTDTDATAYGTYCYTVRSRTENGSSSDSEEACVNINAIDENNANITIAPNPSKGIFRINTESQQSYQVTVYDITGRVVYQNADFQDGILDLQHCNQGVYMMTISNESGKFTQKVVIY